MEGKTTTRLSLGDMTLRPGEAQEVAVHDLLAKRPQVPDVTITFAYAGEYGDIMAATGSSDDSGTYVFSVYSMPVAPSGTQASGYWQVGSGFDTMYTIWNPLSTSQDVLANFYYGDKGEQFKLPVHLEPYASAMLDVGELIRTRQVTPDGNVIPLEAGKGSFSVTSVTEEPEDRINVVISGGVYNPQKATCYPQCTTCQELTTEGVSPVPAGMGVGTNQQMSLWYNIYTGTHYDVTSSSNWSSTNQSIASVQTTGQGTPGLATGIGPGQATLSGIYAYQVQVNAGQVCGVPNPPACPTTQPGGNGPANVGSVTVNSASLWNNQISVTLQGPSNLSGNLKITLNGSQKYTFQYGSSAVGPNTYNVSMTRTNIPADSYSSITAEWDVSTSGQQPTGSRPINWRVFGVIRHSQYNTPGESTCNAVPVPAWIIVVSTCTITPIPGGLYSDFRDKVYLNGTGLSRSYGLLHYTDGTKNQCNYPTGSSDYNTFAQVSSTVGSCNKSLDDTSVATFPNPKDQTTFYCSDDIPLVTSSNTQQALKYVEDYCSGCFKDFGTTTGHMDNYTPYSNNCYGVGDYGNFWTADTYTSN